MKLEKLIHIFISSTVDKISKLQREILVLDCTYVDKILKLQRKFALLLDCMWINIKIAKIFFFHLFLMNADKISKLQGEFVFLLFYSRRMQKKYQNYKFVSYFS